MPSPPPPSTRYPMHMCTNCAAWQAHFDPSGGCPVCLDYRHPLPQQGWRFASPTQVDAQTVTRWRALSQDVTYFWNEPAQAIGPGGYLVQTPQGNIAFEGASWMSDEAIEHVRRLGGVRWLSGSHAHVYGALWRLIEAFEPEVILHRDALGLSAHMPATWVYDERVQLTPRVSLHHTGGHMEGHTVMHVAPHQDNTGVLYCGDALKFGVAEDGSAQWVSCHKAYDANIPLSLGEVRVYRALFEQLDFDAAYTPWEQVTHGAKAVSLQMLDAYVRAGRPSPEPFVPGARAGTPCGVRALTDAYRQDLELSGEPMLEFALDGLDHVGIPVWEVAQWQASGELLTGVGYGPTPERALLGAYGELYEQAINHRHARELERARGSYNELMSQGHRALCPLTLRPPVNSGVDRDTDMVWVQATKWSDKSRVWVPIVEVASHFFDLDGSTADDLPYTPITNGNGAGDTLERAVCHGLLELVQRDGNSALYRALDRGICIDLDSIRSARVRHILGQYDRAGIDLKVKLADTAFGMTNLYVVGVERDPSRVPHPIMLTGCGEAAHPDREVALEKALCEFAASRARKLLTHGRFEQVEHILPPSYLERVKRAPQSVEESRSFEQMKQWMQMSGQRILEIIEPTILRDRQRVRLSSLPTIAPGEELSQPQLLELVLERLREEGLQDVYVVELQPPGAAMKCVKVIVPGMEVETMTYHRIAQRNFDRLREAGSDLVGAGAPASKNQHAIPGLEQPGWFDVDAATAALGPLYAMYREPGFHALANFHAHCSQD